jgi:tripartite-type tricarboxylate transporter receptor subunit TctC
VKIRPSLFPYLALIAECLAAHAQPAGNSRRQAAATGSVPAYPTKPVRVIVPFAPGGGADILACQLAPKLNQHLGQAFVIDNRGGAGGLRATGGTPQRCAERVRKDVARWHNVVAETGVRAE